MKKIDFKTVITKEDLATLSKEKRQFCQKEGIYYYKYLKYKYSQKYLIDVLTKRSREITYLGQQYKDETSLTKEVIASTIVYSDTKKFIEILINKGISYDKLYAYSSLISKTKKIVSSSQNLELEKEENIQLVNKKINNLCSLFITYYGYYDCNLIIAKINEIIIFEKDLYNKLETEIKHQPKTR